MDLIFALFAAVIGVFLVFGTETLLEARRPEGFLPAGKVAIFFCRAIGVLMILGGILTCVLYFTGYYS